MIDVDKLERRIDDVEGPLVALSKAQLTDIVRDLRAGMNARVALARQVAFGDVCSRIAAGQPS